MKELEEVLRVAITRLTCRVALAKGADETMTRRLLPGPGQGQVTERRGASKCSNGRRLARRSRPLTANSCQQRSILGHHPFGERGGVGSQRGYR